jgi:hypothetical protein
VILKTWFGCCSIGLLCALSACGKQAALDPGAAMPAVVEAPAAGVAAPAELPPLAQLARPTRGLSLAGPGWLMLEQAAVLDSSGMTPGAGTAITLHGAGAYAYALYGVYGFDGDNGPTSLRIKSGSVSGGFYIGFSDYEHGKWIFSGPYSFGAGGGTAVVTIPNTGEYLSPHAFVAETYHATYAAVIVRQGSLLTGATVELGVHGGELGPSPVSGVHGYGGPAGMSVHWQSKPAVLAPDFAGYMVERAEQFTGGYAPVSAAATPNDYIDDPLALVGRTYRYRVAAVDVGGNRSVWVEGTGSRLASGAELPVPVIRGLPAAPVFGPATLTLDMSESFDPNGFPISNYKITDGGNEVLYDAAGYALSLTLQPGCHVLRFTVTANGVDGYTLRYIKVFPRWRPGAVQVVSPQPQPVYPRMADLGLARFSDGSLCLSGMDQFAPAFVVRRMRQGQPPLLSTKPQYGDLQHVAGPVAVGDQLYYALATVSGYEIVRYDGERLDSLQTEYYPSAQANPLVALAADPGGRLWSVFAEDDMGLRLKASGFGPAGEQTLVDPLPSILSLDAVYDPSADALWVAYSTNAETRWLKLNLPGLGVAGSGMLAAFAAPAVDLEFDPVAQQPIAAYYSLGDIYYTYYDGIWHLGEQVDNSVALSSVMDLEPLAGRPRVLATEIGGQPRIYTRDALNSWSQRAVAYSSASGINLALAAYEDADGAAYGVGDIRTDRHDILAHLHGDGSETVLLDQWPTTGVGYQMQAAGGSDGLHVVLDQWYGNTLHLRGGADGQSWSAQPMPAGSSQLDLCALADGTVYLSYYDGANHDQLARWDGAAWAGVSTQPASGSCRPFLTHGYPRAMVSWASFNSATLDWTAVEGDQANGYDTTTKPFQGGLAWSGTGILSRDYLPPGSRSDYFVLRSDSGFGYISSVLNQYTGLDDPGTNILYTQRGFKAMFDPYVAGSNVACGEFINLYGGGGVALWASNGTGNPAARYTPNSTLQDQITELPTDPTLPGYDFRRTVSALTTSCATAAALVCDLSGQDRHLEWSNYGAWEELPLPPPDANYASDAHMNHPVLFCGADGRWHIIYRDYDTDALFIRSTL